MFAKKMRNKKRNPVPKDFVAKLYKSCTIVNRDSTNLLSMRFVTYTDRFDSGLRQYLKVRETLNL